MSKQGEYKQTEIGKIPKEWEVLRLERIFDIRAGGDIYKLNFSKQKDERYKFPIYSNSLENNGLYGYADTYQYQENCITVTGRGTLGHATPRFEKFSAIIRLLVLIPKSNINIVFASEYINARISFRIEKTSIPQLTAPKLAKYKIPLPPLPEQKRIAEILSTVDEAIEKVDEAIAKTERLKKGLMQELLNGSLRVRELKSSRVGESKGQGVKAYRLYKPSDPETYKNTEIGRIPKEWEVVRLGDVCTQRKEIILPVGKGQIKFIGLEHIESGKTKVKSFFTDSGIKSSKFKFYRGDILYGKLRPYLDKAVIAEFGGICSTDLIVLTSDEKKYIKELLIYVLHSDSFIRYAISNTSGTNHPRTSWKAISNYNLVYPPLPEQHKIAEILSTIDKRLELLRNKKERLGRVKKGLMNDLLTGSRRVKRVGESESRRVGES